ncbi:MAG: homoserine kinase [Symploca sp. SIO2E6]|nr:homoserine kinase [Symploca sp. SIO2E6]
MPPITVTVPASTANLGPGFDCIGAALTLYNQFKFTCLDSREPEGVRITVTGTEAPLVNLNADNLVYQTFLKYYQYLNQTPPSVEIAIELGVPLARGLGSSATAIVGGLVGANQLAGDPLNQIELMNLAIALEGHPDNVVPALLGGCRLAAKGEETNNWEICDIPWHTELLPVVAIPNFELSTQAAREVLPNDYSRGDAIFNIAHFGLLLRGLATGRGEWLQAALQDRIHQPYRKTLIPGYDTVAAAAVAAGAYGMVISGAGPTLLALVPSSQATAVATAMATAWQKEGVTAQVQTFSVDTQGTRWSK